MLSVTEDILFFSGAGATFRFLGPDSISGFDPQNFKFNLKAGQVGC
jgi:hypothetical protein